MALVSAVESLNMRHIYCLRHLLVSLKKSKFRSQISKLVSVVSIKDYDELKYEYETNWEILDIDDVNESNKYLSKIGLVFKDKKKKCLMLSSGRIFQCKKELHLKYLHAPIKSRADMCI